MGAPVRSGLNRRTATGDTCGLESASFGPRVTETAIFSHDLASKTQKPVSNEQHSKVRIVCCPDFFKCSISISRSNVSNEEFLAARLFARCPVAFAVLDENLHCRIDHGGFNLVLTVKF